MRFSNLLNHKNAPLYALIALLIFIFAVRLVSLNFYPLMSTTEARYAEMSRKMLELNEWVMLFYYDYDTPFWGKPPLSFWASAGSMWLFGVNEFGARFAPFVFGVMSCALFFLWGFRREVGESKALRPIACAVILSSTGIGFVASGAVMTDEALLFCVMLCMISFWKCVVANSACGDFSRSASAHSLQRTASASHSFASHNHENSHTILEFADSNATDSGDLKDSSLRGEAEAIHESQIDCHESANADSRNDDKKTKSTNPPQQTIEGIAVEVAEFLPNFECETRLGVCEHSKFGKSMQDAPKSELKKGKAQNKMQIIFGYLFFIGLGLGLLAKGPLIFVLVGLPIVAFIIALRFAAKLRFAPHTRILRLKNLPLISGTILMLLIALPWYIAFELKSEGFLEYFIIGEHFKRFFISGWEGSMYGAAHSQPIGTIWWFFLISFLPWSVVFLGFVAQRIYGFFRIRSDGVRIATLQTPQSVENLYLALWIVMPLCFLTFSRNILEAYTLPTAPAFCILCANFIFCAGAKFRRWIWLLPLALMLILCAFLASGKLDSLVDSRHQKDIFTRWDGEGRLIFIDAKPSFSGYFYAHQSGKKPFKDEFLSLKSPEVAEILDSREKICIAMKESDFEANKERFGNFKPIVAKKEWILLKNY